MNPTSPTIDDNDTTQDSGTSRPRLRILATLLAITALCAGALTWWWRPWDQEEALPPPPEAVCQDVYNTAELDQILGSSIGSYTIQSYGGWDRRCTVLSGMPAATNSRGYELDDTIMYIEYWHDEEYDAGNGYKWTDETMAADTENGVQKLHTPELDGNTYLWVRESGSENYVHGIWFRDDFTIVVDLPRPENSLDGPKTIKEAMDVMPELLTYIVTQAQEHHAIPNPKPQTQQNPHQPTNRHSRHPQHGADIHHHRQRTAMSSTSPTTDHNDTTQDPDTRKPTRRILAILLTITVLCAGALTWWRPWDHEEEAPSPEAVCQGVYNTAELNRILGSHIGSDHVLDYGGWNRRCTVLSGMPAATDARGYELDDIIMFIEYWHVNEHQAGNGYKWTDETMAADTENNIQKLDIPELEGHTYLWVAPIGSRDYAHGIWFGDGFTIAAVIPHPESNLDGPKTIQEAMDVTPELLTYIGTQAREHHAIPNHRSSKTPSTPAPSDAADTPSTAPTSTSNQPTGTPTAS